MERYIQYEKENGVATVTLNRPDKLNAFVKEMNKEITRAVQNAAKDDTVRALVMTGNGRAFCSGQDLEDVRDENDFSVVLKERYEPMMKAIVEMEKPVIAAVNGVAAGAGMSLALAADFRLVHEKATFVEAFIHIGLIPDSGNLYFLPRLVGHAKALELAMLGEKITAAEAERLGLATKVIADDAWEEEVHAFAGRLANMPTKALGLIKRYMRKSWDHDFTAMLKDEAYGQKIAGESADYREGVAAFLEKRKPRFSGK